MKNSLTDTFTLRNGVPIPCVGFGTWKTPSDDIGLAAVSQALECGYRHIDTAYVYRNEHIVGRAMKESGLARADIFLTSKLWNTERGYEKTLRACTQSLKNLQTDYLDLYLIHWPANEKQFGSESVALNRDTWRAFEKLYEDGLIRAIGLSNFLVHHMEAVMATANIPPMVDQIEYHPGYTQNAVVDFCKKNGIIVEAWSPLGNGTLLGDPDLAAIAKKYGVSVAQLIIRWCLQADVLPLPKSVTPSRIAQNAQVFAFTLCEEDCAFLNSYAKIGCMGLKPDEVDF